MELKKIIAEYGVIGIISNYKNSVRYKGKVKNIPIKDINKALKMVLLNDEILEKDISSLTISELFKIELMSKLENNLIIIGNLSNALIYKDKEYFKKLFIKLSKEYGKKIIIIDNDLKSFFNCVNRICIIEDNRVIYDTNNYFDEKLAKYVNIPNIITFINYVNKDKKRINETIDIYELLKDIYRSVS